MEQRSQVQSDMDRLLQGCEAQREVSVTVCLASQKGGSHIGNNGFQSVHLASLGLVIILATVLLIAATLGMPGTAFRNQRTPAEAVRATFDRKAFAGLVVDVHAADADSLVMAKDDSLRASTHDKPLGVRSSKLPDAQVISAKPALLQQAESPRYLTAPAGSTCAEMGMGDVSSPHDCRTAAAKLGLMRIDADMQQGNGGCRVLSSPTEAFQQLCDTTAKPRTSKKGDAADAIAASVTGATGKIVTASSVAELVSTDDTGANAGPTSALDRAIATAGSSTASGAWGARVGSGSAEGIAGAAVGAAVSTSSASGKAWANAGVSPVRGVASKDSESEEASTSFVSKAVGAEVGASTAASAVDGDVAASSAPVKAAPWRVFEPEPPHAPTVSYRGASVVPEAAPAKGKETTNIKVPVTPVNETAREPTLFCFSVARVASQEPVLLKAQLFNAAGIFGCDEYTVLTAGGEVMLSPVLGTVELNMSAVNESLVSESAVNESLVNESAVNESTVKNSALFRQAWDTIIERGDYKKHDWTVKVDPDTVFFPRRLREHLQNRTMGKEVFFTNCDRFPGPPAMFGALEVFSSGAIHAYSEGRDRCYAKLDWQSWSEDLYMQRCMELLGVDSEYDGDMVSDVHCWPTSCHHRSKAAFHSYKRASKYLKCWEQAEEGTWDGGFTQDELEFMRKG